MRRLAHPGPPAEPRREAIATRLKSIAGELRPGALVMDEVARILREAGCQGGVLHLEGGRCDPFRYVLPALSTDGLHAAWYSGTIAPPGGAARLQATAIVGLRDGAPFLHCHGLWDTGEDAPRMGHMLPLECRVAEPVAVCGFASPDAGFEAVADAETAFTLFSPREFAGSRGPATGRRGLLLRLRPNEDVCTAVEAAAAQAGLRDGTVHGIGSINEIVFEDGAAVRCLATEIAIETGTLKAGSVRLDIAAVDIAGAVARGRLRPGDNPVGVTFELVIAAHEGEPA